MKKITSFLMLLTGFLFITSCTVVRQGEVGVKRKLGKYVDKPYTEGLKFYNPFTQKIIKVPVQTENLEVSLILPSKEGLNIGAEISILYNVMPQEVPNLLRNTGMNYESNVILPVFRSAIADVSSKYYAKDMHTGERGKIEIAIKDHMDKVLRGKGIAVEAVLFKSIKLPPNLARAIEEKLQAEQSALRMDFVLQEAEREAERKRIEAAGIRDAQIIIAEGLSNKILQYKSIEAFMKLADSPNTKIIVSDGDMPMILGSELEETVPSKKINSNQRFITE